MNEESRASPELMVEIFEIRSEIEDAETEKELDLVFADIKKKYDEAVASIKKHCA